MKKHELVNDSVILDNLNKDIQNVIDNTPWEKIRYTVPGSMEKMIEVKGGLINAFKRIQKGIELIEKGTSNDHQEENKES